MALIDQIIKNPSLIDDNKSLIKEASLIKSFPSAILCLGESKVSPRLGVFNQIGKKEAETILKAGQDQANLMDKLLEEVYLKTLNAFIPEDFNTEYYRSLLMITIFNKINLENKFSNALEPSLKILGDQHSIIINLDKRGEISIDDITCKQDDFKQKLKAQIKDKAQIETVTMPYVGQQTTYNTTISITLEKGANYKSYRELYNEIKLTFNELWEESSKELFNESFKALTKEKQFLIKSITPFNFKDNDF